MGTEARLYYYEGEKPQSQIVDPHLRIVDERRLSTKIQRMKYMKLPILVWMRRIVGVFFQISNPHCRTLRGNYYFGVRSRVAGVGWLSGSVK